MARFIEGEGWIADEDVKPPVAAGAASLVHNAKAKGAQADGNGPLLSTESLAAALSARGMVVLSVDEHEAFLVIKEDHEKLKLAHGELQTKLAEIDQLAGTTAKARTVKHTMEEMEALISACTDLDQLTALMKDEERKTVLKLGDARAKEIQEGQA